MRFHSLTVWVVVGASSSPLLTNAFAFPKPVSTPETTRHRRMTRTATATATLSMAARNDGSQYEPLEEKLPNSIKGNGGDVYSNKYNENSSTSKNSRKPNARTERLRSKLEADLAAAEESRLRAAEKLADAESSRQALETEAAKAAEQAEAYATKFKAFEVKEAARAAAGGGSGFGVTGFAGEIAGPLFGGFATLGGLAAARASLAARRQKAEEELLQREEEERKAVESAKRKATQQEQTKNLLPIVSAGVVGLGALFATESSGENRDTLGNTMNKNSLSDIVFKQKADASVQNNAGAMKTAVPGSSTIIDLPYLDKEIVKTETKQKQKTEVPPKESLKRQLGREVAEEQRSMEARLERKLAEAPEIAQKSAEADAAAESKAVEKAKLEVEKKILLEKEAATRKALEEKRASEAKQAKEKKASEEATAIAAAEKKSAEKKAIEEVAIAAEKAKADKIAADRLAFEKMKAEETAKAETIAAQEKVKADKIALDKLSFEKMKAEQKAKAEEAASSLQLLKQQESQSQSPPPKVPAVSEMLFGNNKPSLFTDRGLSNVFSPNKVFVGGAVLAGVAVAAAVVAANESPSVSSTFKVTGKSPEEYLESKDADANETSTPKKTIRIPQSSKEQIENQAALNEQNDPRLPGSKDALRTELANQRANINRQAAEEESRRSNSQDIKVSALLKTDVISKTESMNSMDESLPALVPIAKKSFSPFKGGKSQATQNDSLYSPPVSQEMRNDTNQVQTIDQSMISSSQASTSYQDTTKDAAFAPIPKKSFSPFGTGRKPKAAAKGFLYYPPASSKSVTDTSRLDSQFQPTEGTSDRNVIERSSSTLIPKRSYTPFGGGKPNTTGSDALYSPPDSYSGLEPMDTKDDMCKEVQAKQTTNINFLSVGEDNSEAALSDPLDSTPLPQYEAATVSQVSSLTTNSFSPAQKNYLPFGRGKPFPSTDNSLYRPPILESQCKTGDYNIPSPEISRPTPEEKYSPFEGTKSIVSPDTDVLDSPLADELIEFNLIEDKYLPFSANEIDDASSAAGLGTTGNNASTIKRSFSPFGSKPKAPSVNNDGYLDGL